MRFRVAPWLSGECLFSKLRVPELTRVRRTISTSPVENLNYKPRKESEFMTQEEKVMFLMRLAVDTYNTQFREKDIPQKAVPCRGR